MDTQIQLNSTHPEKAIIDINKNDVSITGNKDTHRYAIDLFDHRNEHSQSLYSSADNTQGWTKFHTEGEMTLYKREKTTPDGRVIDPLRLFSRIDKVSAYEALFYFWDTKVRLEWEHTIQEVKILETLDPFTIVTYQTHKRVWPSSRRDSVYLSNLEKIDFKTDDPCYIDTWIVTNFSVEHDDAKLENIKDDDVRVFINICMMCQTFKIDKDKPVSRDNIYTKVIYIAQVDPGGWVPPVALRAVYKKEYPKFMRKFTKYMIGKVGKNKDVLVGPR